MRSSTTTSSTTVTPETVEVCTPQANGQVICSDQTTTTTTPMTADYHTPNVVGMTYEQGLGLLETQTCAACAGNPGAQFFGVVTLPDGSNLPNNYDVTGNPVIVSQSPTASYCVSHPCGEYVNVTLSGAFGISQSPPLLPG
jgi:hypothetical protein